jgi:Tfp pilus assembly protein PilF
VSLIADALKMAQREKQRRESGETPDISPVLVPLRVGLEPRFSWRRALTMGLSVMITVSALGIMVIRMRKPKPPLAALPPITNPLPRVTAVDPRDWRPQLSSRAVIREPILPPATPRQPTSTHIAAPSSHSTGRQTAARESENVESNASAVVPRGILQGEPARRLKIAVEQPNDADPARLFAQALAAHRAGDLGRARFLYERVLVVAPNHADALNNLGVLLSTQRQYEPALDMLRRAASVSPNNAGTWSNIGSVLREQGRGSDAIAAFRHALTLDPRHQGAKIGLAQQYLASGSVKDARALLEDVLSTNPGVAEAHYALGQALEMHGDRVGAIREYSEFIRRAPPALAAYVERTRRHVDSLSTSSP